MTTNTDLHGAMPELYELARCAGLPMSWLDKGVASAWPELEKFADLVRRAAIQQAAVPEGWRLVPVEPTPEMLDSYRNVKGSFQSARSDWAAMLEASPAPPKQQPALGRGDGGGVPIRWHELKTDPEVFDAVARGAKTHEVRRDDRGFKVGDGLLLLRTKYTGAQMHMRPEACPLEYTGEECRRIVSHILTGYGIDDNWCVLSFVNPDSAGQGMEGGDHG